MGKALFPVKKGLRLYSLKGKTQKAHIEDIHLSSSDLHKLALHFYKRGLDDSISEYSEKRDQTVEDVNFPIRQLKRIQANWKNEGIIR